MSKKEILLQIKNDLLSDITLPLRETANKLVFGEGNPDADLYFLGEAPGRHEDETGRPFVGLAGKLFDKMLTTVNLSREEVYISSIVRFRPPKNRPPTAVEIKAFAPSVVKEISTVNPKLIIPLGRFALEKFMPGEKISQVHGKIYQVIWEGRMLTILPLYHPAAALRSTRIKNLLAEDFKKIHLYLKLLPLYFS
jgi:uracil-DNA glycosylase family 4